MKKLITILILVLVFSASLLVACNDRENKVEYCETDLYWKTSSYSSLIYVVNASQLTTQECEAAASLQGIVAGESASIFIVVDEDSENWLNVCKDQYDIIIQKVDGLWDLVDIFKTHIAESKYVLYKSSAEADSTYGNLTVNYATTVSGVEKYIMISESLESAAKLHGLTLGKDVREETTESVFEEYKDRLNRSFLVHQAPDKWQLRDYCIAAGAMCYYADIYDGNSNINNTILSWAEDNIPVLGWTENEVNFVQSNSMHSKITLAADWSDNLSFYSAFEAAEEYKQTTVDRNLYAQGKHHVAIVMSDGDNLQWMQKGFCTDEKYFGSSYRGDFPMTWTISPSMYNLAPQILEYLYKNAKSTDQFIAGPSGVGYVNVTDYNSNGLARYAQISASYLAKTDLKYINYIDGDANKEALAEFAKYDSVLGGVWSVGNMYLEGGGAVYWENDKPFVTVRETLWRVEGDDASNSYYGFVERVAQRINEYSTDCTKIEGYTVVIAHAWSIGSMDYVNRFVQLLDEDVELVTVSELLNLISENVAHEDVETLQDIEKDQISPLAPISSEQFVVKNFDGMQTDTQRNFNFESTDRSTYKWKFGNGGLQYDSAGYASAGIKLDGSDLNDVIDPMPNSWVVNKFELTDEDKYLQIFASIADVRCDVNFRVRVITLQNGTIQSSVLSSPKYDQNSVNDYGWYLMNKNSPVWFDYDISAYSGKTVFISIEQDDTGDGDGEIIYVSRVKILSEIEDGSGLQCWDKYQLSDYWTKSGDVIVHKEGLCLEGEGAKINSNVVVSSSTLHLYIRKFQRSITQGQDVSAFIVVKFNGEIVRAEGAFTDYLEVSNMEENFYYTFDFSQFVGQSGILEIVSIEVNGVVGDHACIMKVEFA